MSTLGKRKQKLQDRLGSLRDTHGHGCCWTCGSGHGVKAGREGHKTRCTRCEEAGSTNEAVVEYDAVKAELARLNASNRKGRGVGTT